VASNPISELTAEQYLAMDRAAEFRSEFVHGRIMAMAGASTSHALIQRNLLGEIYMALRGGICGPFGSDSRVMVSDQA
jgi:Uma2 family endonuclease